MKGDYEVEEWPWTGTEPSSIIVEIRGPSAKVEKRWSSGSGGVVEQQTRHNEVGSNGESNERGGREV
ncbi:hypothetical protein CDL15_Pgr022359 [Punica granatum]|nr:hypothetical protein CDL15_Pgr022359 [Punica granatum]